LKRSISYWLIAVISLVAVAPRAERSVAADTRPVAEERGASGLALALRRLQTIASVLHTGAHPDDESTELLAYLARGLGARAAYLSLNRGEGGQNGIGPEMWEGLGVIRTEELLAARRLDGAEQYFTRAFDFGYTRSVEETLRKWNREEILGDMVRVIRMMRPLVVVNGFSGTSDDGHGQHQVAGLLTPEAIKAAADPSRFPEQLREGLQPWQVRKLYGRIFRQTSGTGVSFDVGEFDPVLGRSYQGLAADGRSRHRSQDFGMIQPRGSQVRFYPRVMSLVEVPERETSLFTGLETSVTGLASFAAEKGTTLMPGLVKVKDAAWRALSEYRAEQPERIAPHLAAGLREVRALRALIRDFAPIPRADLETMLARKEWEFTDALAKAHGVVIDALSVAEIVAPGEEFEVTANLYLSGRGQPENGTAKGTGAQIALRAPEGWQVAPLEPEPERASNTPAFFRLREKADGSQRFRLRVPESESPTQPYWLARERTREQFDWDDAMPRNLPFAPPRVEARVELTLSGERVTLFQPVEHRYADKTFGEIRRELKIAPALSVALRPALVVIPRRAAVRSREISIEVSHQARGAHSAAVRLIAPPGWKVEGDARELAFTQPGERASRLFRVTPPADAAGEFELRAVAASGGREYASGHTPIAYPHINPHFIYHPARTRAEVFDVEVAAGLRVGYIRGSGDDIPEALAQLGVDVREIDGDQLAAGDLSIYDTIILGIRVYEVREDVAANNRRLLDYAAQGGTLIVQYNKQELARGGFAPYPVKMDGRLRVADETAPVTILAPDHPRFNFPNRITKEDWEGWVQERGLYFLNEWDPRYTPLIEAKDESGALLRGGELIAPVGKGQYVFTAYSWFRQLPAGVPGAYRLFANLISLPKAGRK
jgi:LmbE family N-acetylglucosaminyl deacetylase